MRGNGLSAALILERDGMPGIGNDRIALLRAVDETGSIAEAARQTGLSYRAAWNAIDILNNLMPFPVVIASSGGRSGGGAQVTERGHLLLAGYSRMETAVKRAMARLEADLSGLSPQASSFFRSISMQTSTRNVFLCTVSGIVAGPVSSEVDMKLTDERTITATITERSVQSMGLHVGSEVYALIKAPAISLIAGVFTGKISARNVLSGAVLVRKDGVVNSEIIVDIGGGKSVTSLITMDAANELGLKVGDTVTALFKASQVIIALP